MSAALAVAHTDSIVAIDQNVLWIIAFSPFARVL
jgi:hypothetical protein